MAADSIEIADDIWQKFQTYYDAVVGK